MDTGVKTETQEGALDRHSGEDLCVLEEQPKGDNDG